MLFRSFLDKYNLTNLQKTSFRGLFLGDLPIRVEGDLARLVGGDGATGNIAGSTTTVAQEAKNLMDWGIVTAEQAIIMNLWP